MNVKYPEELNVANDVEFKLLIEATNDGFCRLFNFCQSKSSIQPQYGPLTPINTTGIATEQYIASIKNAIKEYDTMQLPPQTKLALMSERLNRVNGDLQNLNKERNNVATQFTQLEDSRVNLLNGLNQAAVSKVKAQYKKNELTKRILKCLLSVLLCNEDISDQAIELAFKDGILKEIKTLKFNCSAVLLDSISKSMEQIDKSVEESNDGIKEIHLAFIKCIHDIINEAFTKIKISNLEKAYEEVLCLVETKRNSALK